MKAVFLDRGSFPKYIKVTLPASINDFVEYENTSPDEVAERIQDANIVLTNKVVLNADALNQAPHLGLVQVMATGMNNVDLEACAKHNISVQNVAGYSNISVPEHTFAMLLALRRNLASYLEDVKAGKWADSQYFCFLDYPIKDLSGSTMAIIGGGTLGKKVAAIALAFGMTVVFAERKGAQSIRNGYIDFEEALTLADVISINCPLTPDTKNLISDAEFSLMKPSSLLLNISRGGIVDEPALVRAFDSNRIAGAAFDVASQEPMPLDHPLQALTQRRNFLLTPHIAWGSNEAMQTLVNMAMDKITAFIDKPE
ncbi:D-2-hydroxyacid dehydrogenase [Marinomonas sp. M1K-6]|uniref:D-2-hydroxyacid dehydrogenase n=1 Tax=Marinomonas profundi TaxID=2726122 RepID=A0A847R5Q7_9GAMM|nr:D-2-hydroxyacid dehydrogenase [Marinomonas profundi]NLQ16377.1 D-2-hydroxyacid dehydrogenase [Marinomonas profundi]UDV03049.1 D-2-hydroxyacid dehydrogenase [Marinomonas profundi]